MTDLPVLAAALVLTLAASLLAASARIEAVRERIYPPAEMSDESLYSRAGALVRHLAIAYQALAADVYWIRAIQYYGGTKRAVDSGRESGSRTPAPGAGSYPLLYPLLDLTTSLDP